MEKKRVRDGHLSNRPLLAPRWLRRRACCSGRHVRSAEADVFDGGTGVSRGGNEHADDDWGRWQAVTVVIMLRVIVVLVVVAVAAPSG